MAWVEPVLDYLGRLPWLVLLLAAAPLVLIAFFTRSHPRRPLVWLMIAPCVATGLMLLADDFFLIVIALDAAIILVALGDLISLPKQASFSVEREVGRIASLRQQHRVNLTISNHGAQRQRIEVRDGVPQEFVPTPEEFDLTVAPRSRASVHYDVRSIRRGAFELHETHIRAKPLGPVVSILPIPGRVDRSRLPGHEAARRI